MNITLRQQRILAAAISVAGAICAFVALCATTLPAQQPIITPLVSRQDDTVTITTTLPGNSTVHTAVRVIELPHATTPIISIVSARSSALTLTVLLDTLAGGGTADSSALASLLSTILSKLEPDDFIAVAVANHLVLQDAVLKWTKAGADPLAGVLPLATLALKTLDESASRGEINDKNYVAMLNAALNIRGNGQFIILVTNGFQVQPRAYQVPSFLVQLRMPDTDAFFSVNEHLILAEYAGRNALAPITSTQLVTALLESISALRTTEWVISYPTTHTSPYTAQLIINGSTISVSIPAGVIEPTPMPAPLSTVTGQSVQQAQTVTTTVATGTETSSAPSPLLFTVPLLLAAALIAIGVYVWIIPRPHLIIGKRKVNLRGPLWLGRTFWNDVDDDTLAIDHALLSRDPEHGWVITVQNNGHMHIDGLRSRKNRLRSGSRITLGEEGKAECVFMNSASPSTRISKGVSRDN